MALDFNRALGVVLVHEGGWVNHPRDPGGETNLGVTKKVWEAWTKKKVPAGGMKKLTVEDVTPLYKKNYWDKVQGDKLPAGLDLMVFDFAVNSGPKRAAEYLQRLVGATVDGKIGPKTLAAVDAYKCKYSKNTAVKNYANMRRAFYRSLRTFPTFGRGWLRRVDEVEHKSLLM